MPELVAIGMLIFGWSIVGLIIYSAIFAEKDYDFFDSLNPFCIYKTYKVNIFGTLVLFIFFNLLCPIGTITYWFYKLCTVGRR